MDKTSSGSTVHAWLRRVASRHARMALAAAALSGALCAAPACSGAAEYQSLAQMDHAMWTARDGAPQGILALAQAADGTLWIGAENGLFNFDGVTFTAFKSAEGDPEVPVEPANSVYITKDGGLWVGFFQAGAAYIKNGRVKLYPKVGDTPIGVVRDLVETSDGSIWALSNQARLLRFDKDGAWHVEPAPADKGRIGRLFIDSSSTMWLAQNGRLYRRPLSQASYTATDVEVDLMFGISEAPDGSVWITDAMLVANHGRTQHVDHFGHLIATLPDDNFAFDILYARDGSLIIATQGKGLHRFPAENLAATREGGQASPDVFGRIEGLTSDDVRALMVDADGNLWVGGQRGLDRFRRSQIVRFVPKRPSLWWGVCAGKQGPLWISGFDDFYKVSGGVPALFPQMGGSYALDCSQDGDAWLAASTGLWHVHADRASQIPSVPGAPAYGVQQIVATSDHTLYASAGARGYWRYQDGQWSKVDIRIPKALWTSYIDSQDRLWLGHHEGFASLLLEGRWFPSGDPGVGTVRAIQETSHGLLAAGTNGLAAVREKDLEMLAFEDSETVRGVRAIVESRNGDVWLNAARGIVRIGASEVDAALNRRGYRMKSDLLAEGDFAGARQGTGQNASAARDADGKLWFVTVNGVVSIDPEHWRAESRPPIVSIKSIAVDHSPLDRQGVIGPRPRVLEIRYFGVNLTAPDQVIYKYRLEGFDDTWQEVGRRTEAIYTRLPAGSYTFKVMASNGDGVWTSPISTETFTVQPSFYQTTWFAVLCVCAALVIIWLAFTVRVRAITREVRARAEERADERIRIARELHDTLLQGIQGLLLTFHVAAQKISPDNDSRTMLDQALTTADRIIVEGRNRVSRLRSEHLNDSELVASLENVCKDLQFNGGVECRIDRSGTDATLYPHVSDEIFYVAREALTNAFRHAHASHIALDLTYGECYFTMVCKDDGRGFATDDQDMTGHWGLKGMAERVRKLGGKFRCRSTPQDGTEILVSIPAYKAYPKHSRVLFYMRALTTPT